MSSRKAQWRAWRTRVWLFRGKVFRMAKILREIFFRPSARLRRSAVVLNEMLMPGLARLPELDLKREGAAARIWADRDDENSRVRGRGSLATASPPVFPRECWLQRRCCRYGRRRVIPGFRQDIFGGNALRERSMRRDRDDADFHCGDLRYGDLRCGETVCADRR